jgi:hypothetical protein
MNEDQRKFLEHVKNYVSVNPDIAPYVTNFVADGLRDALNDTKERAADMEAALCVSLAKRYGSREEIIISKLEKWHSRSSLNWDSMINQLKEIKK